MPSEHKTFIPLAGSRHQPLAQSRPAGPLDSSEVISITVRTRPATSDNDLERKVAEIYSQPIASREYVAPEKMAAEHGADPHDLDLIETYAQKHNLVVSHRSEAERSLVLTGKLADLTSAFPADLHLVHHSTGSYRARRGEILIPEQLKGIITGIFGYDTRPKQKAPSRHRAAAAAGPGGGNGVSPVDYAKRYKFPTQFEGAKLDGTGQCIGIIELGGGFASNDLNIYFKELAIPLPNVVAVSVDHTGNHPTKNGLDDGEVMLDIEVAGAVAPKAKIAVYFAPNTNKGFLDAINFAIHDTQRKPSVISISWGGPEATADQQSIDAYHQVFLQAAALGVTICTASGDHGTADIDSDHWDNQIHVDHPSVDPLVLACGGTQIDAHGKDVVWNDGTPFNKTVLGGGGWASGGGISELFGLPDYQKGANLPVSIVSNKPGRGVPDIAMSATDYFTRVQGSEGASGGTSAVAPLMAALVAILNQAKKKNVGFLNPLLYKAASSGVVTDVVSGTNAIKDTVKGYTAGAGWDACTGLGTPDGEAILAALGAKAAGA
jgi:kumamolisin